MTVLRLSGCLDFEGLSAALLTCRWSLLMTFEKVLHRSPKIVLPDHTTINSLMNNFGKYFADQIAKLRSGLLSTDADPPVRSSYKNKFVSFRIMSEDESP